MNDYISREAVLSKCDDIWNSADETTQTGVDTINTIDKITDFIESLPAADVQPVKRGKWEQDEKGAFHHCSECESKTFRDVDGWGYEYQEYLTDYCFRCGARMDGEQND